jgi:N-acetylmuramoyl-L-alanine amidase
MELLINSKKGRLKPNINVIFCMLMLQVCLVFGQAGIQKKVLLIDPGHGGLDSGAVGINGILEKEIVLNIAHEILMLNRSLLNNEFDIYLTRYNDTLISLTDRARLALNLNCDLFLSIHCNAAKTGANGMEVYIHPSNTPYTGASIKLGKSILSESISNLGLDQRGAKKANFQVLRETRATCPSILIETGFITNKNEADYLNRPNNVRGMALAILLGVYKNTKGRSEALIEFSKNESK